MPGQSKRLSFWRGLSVGEIVFLLVASLLVLCALWWIIKVEHRFWRTTAGSALFTIGFIAGASAIIFMRVSARRVVLVSPCPCCGAVARRSFSTQDTQFAEPCGTCPAYLRIKGDDVFEQPLDGDDHTPYKVPPERYLPAVKDQKGETFHFVMPQICASCGSPEATQRRVIAERYKSSSSGPSALGTAVSIAADVANVPSFSAHDYGAMGTRAQDRSRDTPSDLDIALRDLEFPVCAADVKGGSDPVEYDSGELFFRSYRFYREFLRLNHIDGVKPR